MTMKDSQIVTGMVLNAMPIGEYDKRVSLLTLERGKISAFFRGARRPKSPLLAASNPFTFGKFELYESSRSAVVHRAEVSQYFDVVAKDLTIVWYGSYFLETAEYYARENADERERLTLLFQSLRALESGKFDAPFVRLLYEAKTIALSGEYPNVYECLSCGSWEKLSFFSMSRRGMICEDCAAKDGDTHAAADSGYRGLQKVSASAVYTMQFIFATPAKKLFTFRLSEEVCRELEVLLSKYRRRYFPHPFKSEAFLEL